MKKPMYKLLPLVALLSCSSLAFAGSITYSINFEQLPAYTVVTNQYAAQDVVFSDALQLVAPSYDYFDFPPNSGSGVITNDPNDPIQLNFTVGMLDVTGWYSDPYGVVVIAYDSGNNPLSAFFGAGDDGANAPFWVGASSTADPISYVTIGDVYGFPDNETVDDVSFTTTPEPSSVMLFATGLLGLVLVLRRKFAR
jgi:hypothetical protein